VFGFFIGTASLIGLVWVLGHGRDWGHGWHSARPRLLYRLFERLDSSPGQEKVIRAAIEEFGESLRERARAVRESAEEIARVVRGERLDESALTEVFARHDQLLAELRRDLVSLLGRVHEVLDERQRRRLAHWIETGPGWAWCHHAHRLHHERHGCACAG
jgi:hypothetical protein